MPGSSAKALADLKRRYTWLSLEGHDLHHFVKACEECIAEHDDARASDQLVRIEQGVAQEEKTLDAAFNIFSRGSASMKLSAKEIAVMLDYLGFPSTPSDVEFLIQACDKDGDGLIDTKEFQSYVGKMGGSYKLFEVRRARVAEKIGDVTKAGVSVDPMLIREDLKSVGITEQEQMFWKLVLPRAEEEFVEAIRLKECQRKAVRDIRTLAKSNHDQKLSFLQMKVRAFGYSDDDLWMTLAYIRELAPIIIHINMDKMLDHMENDTHYRNQFETGSSGGLLKPKVREQWEKKLFCDHYKQAHNFDRCKYGVLNCMNDYKGVVKCHQYGDSYIVLRDCRLRCTLSPEDSANLKAEKLAVLDYYAHVLCEYSLDELQETMKIAKYADAAVLGDSGIIGKMKYKEVQIHGELKFDRHVERLVAHPRHRDKKDQRQRLEALTKKHGWSFSWMDQERDRMKVEESPKLGEDAWREKLKALMDAGGPPDLEGVQDGYCKKGCDRPVRPGKTAGGNAFQTCCRGCAIGFGHDLTCGNVDPEMVKPGWCTNGCGRPANKGRMASGRRYVTCCKSCARGSHDETCGKDCSESPRTSIPRGTSARELPGCRYNCGRKVAPPTGGRHFDTCCKGCAVAGGKVQHYDHDAGCIAGCK